MPAKAKKAKALPKIQLSERGLKSLQNGAPYLDPFDVMDTDVRAFGARVLKTGEITFILRRRFPGSKKPTRRAIGRYGELSLAQASPPYSPHSPITWGAVTGQRPAVPATVTPRGLSRHRKQL